MFSRRELFGGAMGGRLIDPVGQVVRTGDESLGYVPQREMTRRQERQLRTDADSERTERFVIMETIQAFYPNPPANATTQLMLMIATTSTTFSLSSRDPDVPMQGRVVAIRIMANGDVTAGTLTPVIYITENGGLSTYVINECELSTAIPNTKSVMFDWPNAIQFAKAATWNVAAQTSAAYAPTTLDVTIWITFGYEQWV